VLFGRFDWSVSWMQFHRRLMHELAALDWTVLWVGSYLSGRRDGWKHWLTTPTGELMRDGACWHFRPWTLPFNRFDHVIPLWSAVQAPAVRAVFRRLGLDRPAVMLIAPSELPLLRMVPHGLSLYWTGDEVILPGEPALVRYVDRILAISDPAHDRHATHADKLLRFSTGVPFRLFHGALASPDVPPELRDVARPIVGYAGSVMASRVDLPVFPELARRLPQASVVVVGPMDDDARAFFERSPASPPNLHVLGSRPYEQVPHYIKCFDVGLIPYLRTTFNLAANPLKLYEYLALGKPVVSTPLPAVTACGDAVFIAEDADGFAGAIAAALADRAASRIEQRLAIARAHDTERLARELAAIVEGAAGYSPVNSPARSSTASHRF
jgi:glycosyltransferase involved in cell wall biosynthesis